MSEPWGDVDDYMDALGARISRGYNGLNRVMECPWCGAESRLYVLTDSMDPDERPNGSYICYKCGERGRSFWRLYATLEGVDVATARAQHIADGASRRKAGWAKAGYDGLYSRAVTVTGSALRETGNGPSPLPPEFIPVWDGRTVRMPHYLVDRGVTAEMAAGYGLGYCERGAYAGRIVFPLMDPRDGRRSFTTRAIRDEGHERRWISGEGASRMVFGWDQALPATDVGIVEGAFDVLGCTRAGLRAIGASGKGLPSDLIELLYRKGVETIWLGLDPDAVYEAVQGGLLAPQSDRLRVMMGLPEGRDPGDAPTEVLRDAWRQCVPLEVAWSIWMRERMEGLVGRLNG